MGTWFEIHHYKGEPFQPNSWTCNQATYSKLDTEKGTFKVYNSRQGIFFGPRFGVHGDAMWPLNASEFGDDQWFIKFFFQGYDDTPNY